MDYPAGFPMGNAKGVYRGNERQVGLIQTRGSSGSVEGQPQAPGLCLQSLVDVRGVEGIQKSLLLEQTGRYSTRNVTFIFLPKAQKRIRVVTYKVDFFGHNYLFAGILTTFHMK